MTYPAYPNRTSWLLSEAEPSTKIVEPILAKKNAGWLGTEKPPHQNFNWFWKRVSEWIEFIHDWHEASTDFSGSAAYTCTEFLSAQATLALFKGKSLMGTAVYTMTCTGSDYSSDQLIIENIGGTGSLYIDLSGVTGTCKGAVIKNCTATIIINDGTIYNVAPNGGFDILNSDKVLLQNNVYKDNGICVKAVASKVYVKDCETDTFGLGNAVGIYAEQSEIWSKNWTTTDYLIDYAYQFSNGSILHLVDEKQLVTTNSDHFNITGGSKIFSAYEKVVGAAGVVVSITANTTLNVINSKIQAIGYNIPKDVTLAILYNTTTGNCTAELPSVLNNFSGGGLIQFSATEYDTSATLTGSLTNSVMISASRTFQNNNIDIKFKEISIGNNNNKSATITFKNCKKVTFDTFNIKRDVGTGIYTNPCIIIDNSYLDFEGTVCSHIIANSADADTCLIKVNHRGLVYPLDYYYIFSAGGGAGGSTSIAYCILANEAGHIMKDTGTHFTNFKYFTSEFGGKNGGLLTDS